MRSLSSIATLSAAAVIASGAASAQEIAKLREVAILTTVTETALATTTLLADRAEGEFETVSFSGEYSEREWIMQAECNAGGRSVQITMTGFLWGADEADWTVSYGGLGRFGDERLSLHGQAEWRFDPDLGDYHEMDYAT